jgi:hypothetical protein
MKIDITIGSLRAAPWSDIRKSYPKKNFLEFNESGLYQWWDNQSISYHDLCVSNDNKSKSNALVTNRLWFKELIKRWATGTNVDFNLILAKSEKIQLAIGEYLDRFEIQSCVGLYGIAHHIWNNIVEQAVFEHGIDTVKIYPILDTNYSFLYRGCNEFNEPLVISNISSNHNLMNEIKSALIDMQPRYTQRECSSGVKATEMWSCRILQTRGTIKNIAKYVTTSKGKYSYDPIRSFAKHWEPRRHNDMNVIKAHREYLTLYNRHSSDWSRQIQPGFVFYSQFEPEATTVPEGGAHYSTIECINQLKYRYPSIPIYYKEHPAIELAYDSNKQPTNVGIARNKEYFSHLKETNCTLLPMDARFSLNCLRRYRLIPVSITGTIVLQAALSGISSVYFGNPWYKFYCNKIPAFCFDEYREYSTLLESNADNCSLLFKDFVAELNKYALENSLNIGIGSPDKSACCSIFDYIYS